MSYLILYFFEPLTVCLKTYMNNIKHEYTALYWTKQEFNIIVTFEKIGYALKTWKFFKVVQKIKLNSWTSKKEKLVQANIGTFCHQPREGK